MYSYETVSSLTIYTQHGSITLFTTIVSVIYKTREITIATCYCIT